MNKIEKILTKIKRFSMKQNYKNLTESMAKDYLKDKKIFNLNHNYKEKLN